MTNTEPGNLDWLLTGDQARSEPIPRATSDDELFVIESNPTHIKWGECRSNGRYPVSYHIGYQTKWGAVALCGVGNDGIPSECRCSPWHPKPELQGTDCEECLNIAKSLHVNGRYPE